MQTIGIVGGIAWPSSLVYYRTIKEHYRERTNSIESRGPCLVMVQTDFAVIEKAQREGDWERVGRILTGEVPTPKADGATAAEYIMNNVDLPMLHIVDANTQEVVECGQQYELNVLVAQGEHEENVDNALYGELTRNVFRAAIADLVDQGAELRQ
ncbi:hypothetical protein BO86DRAFT_404588 [Aspergillus japonicus CBS 114.51]|uniref:Aspartate racemase n=1 Tax=Aspergillus japonicus CBS 114.51 TaxID=1448312 RepID=A0A8T8WKZ4_ASPJA|nr:hypothetical protein BO86DRAFT_404588 [Aspergillus japonicus CBS 114.51]RAH76518.1 hypothetical protein BO86DRAFT_404588 [Aspergillus japonicus CBS 114.51]